MCLTTGALRQRFSLPMGVLARSKRVLGRCGGSRSNISGSRSGAVIHCYGAPRVDDRTRPLSAAMECARDQSMGASTRLPRRMRLPRKSPANATGGASAHNSIRTERYSLEEPRISGAAARRGRAAVCFARQILEFWRTRSNRRRSSTILARRFRHQLEPYAPSIGVNAGPLPLRMARIRPTLCSARG